MYVGRSSSIFYLKLKSESFRLGPRVCRRYKPEATQCSFNGELMMSTMWHDSYTARVPRYTVAELADHRCQEPELSPMLSAIPDQAQAKLAWTGFRCPYIHEARHECHDGQRRPGEGCPGVEHHGAVEPYRARTALAVCRCA